MSWVSRQRSGEGASCGFPRAPAFFHRRTWPFFQNRFKKLITAAIITMATTMIIVPTIATTTAITTAITTSPRASIGVATQHVS